MSFLSPVEPFSGVLHDVPSDAQFISYEVQPDNLIISAWMAPSTHDYREPSQSNDAFYEENCDGCHRNCYSFYDNYTDEDGEIDWDHSELQDDCNVYENGYHGQRCPDGYVKSGNDGDYVSRFYGDMVFTASFGILNKNPKQRLIPTGYNAFLRKGRYRTDTKKIHYSATKPAANVYGAYLENPVGSGICWGTNEIPDSLQGCAVSYYTSGFNNDLYRVEYFFKHCEEMEALRCLHSSDTMKLLTKKADSLFMVDAEQHANTFASMLMAGFQPLENCQHIMAIPVHKCSIKVNNGIVYGYKTEKDGVGLHWFISQDAKLIGQLDKKIIVN
jgi:hypothetical protein